MSNAGIQDALAQANPEKQVKKMEAIIQSMTVKERRNPDLMNPSRKKRIAAGCGMDVVEVNKLIKQHAQMAKMMKKFANPSGMAKMMKSLSGMQNKFGGGGGMGPLFGGNDQKK
jgi:signal recognition particle subunit SRP54